MIKELIGIIEHYDGKFFEVVCPEAPHHLRTHMLTHRQVGGGEVGDNIKLVYRGSRWNGEWAATRVIGKSEQISTVVHLADELNKKIDTGTEASVRLVNEAQDGPGPEQKQAATQPQEKVMQLTLKGLNKKGTAAFYTGAKTVIRLALNAFPGKTAPQTFDIADGIFEGPRGPRVKLTKEERAALPKPTLAERIAKREEALARLKAKAQAEAGGM